jgi:hypothetical protein
MLRRWWILIPFVSLAVGVQVFNPTNMLANHELPEYLIPQEFFEANVELEARKERLNVRLEFKEQLMQGLIEERYTLDQVAREFMRVNSQDEATSQSIMEIYPEATDEAKSAHNVIDFLVPRDMKAAEKDRLMTKLLDDYQQLYGSRPKIDRLFR